MCGQADVLEPVRFDPETQGWSRTVTVFHAQRRGEDRVGITLAAGKAPEENPRDACPEPQSAQKGMGLLGAGWPDSYKTVLCQHGARKADLAGPWTPSPPPLDTALTPSGKGRREHGEGRQGALVRSWEDGPPVGSSRWRIPGGELSEGLYKRGSISECARSSCGWEAGETLLAIQEKNQVISTKSNRESGEPSGRKTTS